MRSSRSLPGPIGRPGGGAVRAARLLGALALALGFSGCALFGTSKPEPPPYPAPLQDRDYRPAWTSSSLGRARPGFTPAVTPDAVWVASAGGEVRRLSRETGRVELEVDLDVELGAGVGSDGSLVAVASRNGDVIVLDANGRRRWSTPLKGEIVTAPLVSESAVVVRTMDGRIVALDRDGGSIKWTFQRPMPALVLRQSSPMVLRDDIAFVGMPGARVMALDLRLGAPRWETVIATPRGATELERLVDIVGAPTLGFREVCAVAYQGKLACLDERDGRVLWSRDIASASGLALAAETVVTVDGSDVVQAVRQSGDAVWKQDGYVRRSFSAPVIVADRVLFTDRFGSLVVLSLADGSTLGRLSLEGGNATGAPVLDDAVAYVQTVGGSLSAIPFR